MISDDYKKIIADINGKENFGKRKSLPKFLSGFIEKINPNTILDFGCGVGNLIETLKQTYPEKIIKGFDPGNKNFEVFPEENFDLIISTDVLEHIEPEFLESTLKFLSTKSRFSYHLIALAPSSVTLPDGRNAHLILENHNWWRNKFLNLDYSVINEFHMKHYSKNKNKLVNKYFIMLEKN